MATITYATLNILINDSLSQATGEAIINHAINKINLYLPTDDNLAELTGSGVYTSAEAAAIMDVAVTVYNNTYVNSGAQSTSNSMGQISESNSTSASAIGNINDVAQQVAKALKRASGDPPIYLSNDPVPTDS
jgi:hypothetical protein